MIKINEKVFQFEKMKVGQLYLVVDNHEITLVDTGMMGDFYSIKAQLEDMNTKFRQIENIIITHGHMDHVANLKKIARLSGAKVYVHKDEASRILGKVKVDKIHYLEDEDVLDILGGLQVIHIPGHTKGNIALYAKDMKLMFSGDSIINENGLKFVPDFYNNDTDGFRENAKKLMDYDVQVLCPGHGIYLDEECNESIHEFLGTIVN